MDDPAPDCGPIEKLVEAFLERRRRGETPSVEEYVRAHPELADEIREVFPALSVIENAAAEVVSSEPAALVPDFPGLEILNADDPGIGGMGKVYKAREVSLDRVVAVKTTRAHLDTPEGRAFFESEARSAARLDHPHIVRVFSFDPDHQPPYYVMPFVEGRPLEEACRGKDHRFVAAMLEKIARALFYAHHSGILHRDIKPANILVDYQDEPHITDFGLAKAVDSALMQAPADVRETSLKGSPYFIAPELYAAEAGASPASDIYALGVTMYVLLTGQRPFAADNVPALREAVLGAEPRLLQEIDPDVPETLQRICLKAMERAPKDRYESARMLADDLRRFLEGREVFARPTRYLRERSGKLHNHLTDIRLWRRQNLIDMREMDRLVRPYRWLLEADSAWDEMSRRFPWETALLRLGGWLAVVSSVLWPAFYWDDLARWQRVTTLAVPCLLVNLVGWMSHRRGARLNAMVFLSTGSLLLPMLIAVVLAEFGWLRFPQLELWELMGDDALQGENGRFVVTNTQVNLTLSAFLIYALVLLASVRAKLFALWVGVGTYLLYSGVLLLLGLRYWYLEVEDFWLISLSYLPVSLMFVLVAGPLLRRDRVGWGTIFYSFFPVPFAVLLTFVARYGAEKWLGANDWDEQPVQLWLMANGLVYLVLGLGHARSAAGVVRFWGELFMLLVPVSLLVPTSVLFEDAPFFGEVGGAGISIYEYAGVLLSITVVVFGTRIRRAAFVAPGLIGLAVAVTRSTERHFQEHLGWPLTLAVLGGLAMIVGALLRFTRSRRAASESAPE